MAGIILETFMSDEKETIKMRKMKRKIKMKKGLISASSRKMLQLLHKEEAVCFWCRRI